MNPAHQYIDTTSEEQLFLERFEYENVYPESPNLVRSEVVQSQERYRFVSHLLCCVPTIWPVSPKVSEPLSWPWNEELIAIRQAQIDAIFDKPQPSTES